jgi:ABC-type polysaccharide/polyol phosphate export permease
MSDASQRRGLRQHPLVQLTLVRIREFLREPEAVFWAVVFPAVMATGLGIAFASQPPAPIDVAAVTPELAAALRQEPGLEVREMPLEDARASLRAGHVALVAEPGDGAPVVFRYDDTNPEGHTARMLADAAIQRAAGRQDPVATTDAIAREPGTRYIDFVIPGLVGIGILGNSVWGLGFSIVDARRRKLTKRLMATPMSRVHFLASYLLWRKLILGVEVVLPIAFGALVFGVPIRGSWMAIVLLSVLCSLACSALGLLAASRAKTIEAVSGLANLIILPMWILSGVFFSSQRFPDVVQPFIQALPLTAFIDALRGVMLEGMPLGRYAGEMGIMAAWTVVCFVLALKLFRWR